MSLKRAAIAMLAFGLAAPLCGCGGRAKLRGMEQDIGELKVRMSSLEGTLGRHEESLRELAATRVEPAPLVQPAAYTPPPAPRRQAPNKPRTRDIQQSLKNAGFSPGRVDGKMGPRTKSALKRFQKANRLKVDGVVGGRTWSKLKWYY